MDSVLQDLKDSLVHVRGRALQLLSELEPAALAAYSSAVAAMLQDSDSDVRAWAVETLFHLEPDTLAQHAPAVAAMLEDSDDTVRGLALKTLFDLKPETAAQHIDTVVGMLGHPHWRIRVVVFLILKKVNLVAQYPDTVFAGLEDSNDNVRTAALECLLTLDPEMLAQYADDVVARLEDSHAINRMHALRTLGRMGPVALAQHAGAVVGRLEDSEWDICATAFKILGKLGTAKQTQHAGVMIAGLEDPDVRVRGNALYILSTLPEPATFRHQVYAVFARLDTAAFYIAGAKTALRCILPRFVTWEVDFDSDANVRSRLLGRLAWHRFRLRRRVECLALYWYALLYRPSGPGHAREVAAWDQMLGLSLQTGGPGHV
tara:strand:+ start:55 stop:1179 length:1125 start_codon:yes stop_codon:yes gene_type:complete